MRENDIVSEKEQRMRCEYETMCCFIKDENTYTFVNMNDAEPKEEIDIVAEHVARFLEAYVEYRKASKRK